MTLSKQDILRVCVQTRVTILMSWLGEFIHRCCQILVWSDRNPILQQHSLLTSDENNTPDPQIS